MANRNPLIANEDPRDRGPIDPAQQAQQNQEGQNAHRNQDAENIQHVSAASLAFALTFLSIFNSYMNHQFPNGNKTICAASDGENPARAVLGAYVALGTTGIMLLFGTALISYKCSLLFRSNKPENHDQRQRILHVCYGFAFIGITCSLTCNAIGIYLMHCNEKDFFLAYCIPTAGLFVLMMLILIALERYLKD